MMWFSELNLPAMRSKVYVESVCTVLAKCKANARASIYN